MAIVPVESYRDDETNKFVSREKGRAAFNPSINLPAISTGSSMMKMSGGAAMQMSPMESMKEVFLEIRDNTKETVELLKTMALGDSTQDKKDAKREAELDIKYNAQAYPPSMRGNYANGGLMGLKMGGRPMEMDYRQGGFIPVGSKERADDVPARLSKNEFVMTADAVRAAGGGSVNKGAKRMYNLMNNLEAK